ncbi:MAG: hypothetical protein OQL06_00510 [Gammaproteobacteria bacterium]|nr:hypothetical protein [Gammaproteobacteria bacterium]
MANIPSINRASALYTRLKRQGPKKAIDPEAAPENTQSRVKRNERRHSTERRRTNIRVLFNRRKRRDRRNAPLPSKHGVQPQETDNRGKTINTTA